MKKFSCLIVEDEPLAAEILDDYIRQVPFLELKAVCSDAMYAMEKLKEEPVDLIFLDIHLPRVKGTDFIRSLRTPPQVIITSAYADYALQGYELNVLDYLLKPIEFARFLAAVNKLQQLSSNESAKSISLVKEPAHLYFNVSKKKVRVNLADILFIESVKEYIRIVTAEKSILTKFQLHEIEALLPAHQFIRVHRSFIIARNKVNAFSPVDIEINGQQIPIGRSYKESVIAALDN